MTAVGHAQVQLVVEACHAEAGQSATPVSTTVHNHAVVLQQALHHIPNQTADCLTRNAAAKLGQHLVSQVDWWLLYYSVILCIFLCARWHGIQHTKIGFGCEKLNDFK